MSLFGRLFGDKSSGSRQEGSQDSVDDLYKELAEAIARNATIYPPAEVIAKLLSQTGYKSIPEDRLRFGLSIANEVINIWLVNDCVPLPHRAKQIVDFAHHFFFEAQSRKDIWIGDFIINTAELSQIAREIEQASNGGVTNVQGIRTNWWGLMDMIYLSRQKIYYELLHGASSSNLSDASSPTTVVAFELGSHLTGTDAKSGGDSFIKLVAGLDAFLTAYAKRTREMLPKLG